MKNKTLILFGAIMIGLMALTLVPKAPGASPLYGFNWYTNVSGPALPQGGSALMIGGSNNVLTGNSGTNLLNFVTNTTVTSAASTPVTIPQGAGLLLMPEATALGIGTNVITFGFNLSPDGVNWTTTEPIMVNMQLNSGLNYGGGVAYSNTLARVYAYIPWLGGFTNGSAGGTVTTVANIGTNAAIPAMVVSPPLAGSYQIRWDYVSCGNTTGAVGNVRYTWLQ